MYIMCLTGLLSPFLQSRYAQRARAIKNNLKLNNAMSLQEEVSACLMHGCLWQQGALW